MKRFRPAVLMVSSVLVLTACGSTVPVRDRGAAAGNGGVDTAGLTGDGGGQVAPGGMPGDVVGSGPSNGGGSVAQPGVVQPGEVGSSPGGAAGPSGGSQVVTPGVTSKQPMQIGVLITDTDSFKKATGVGESYSSLTRAALHAYIKDINAAGGVAGRKLTVVDFTFQYAAASYDNEFSAACQTFTKDNHVGAVIYDGIVYNQNFNTCLTKAGVPVFYMGQAGTSVGDSTDFANHPGMFTAGSMTVDRRLLSILNKAIAGGFLRSGNRLGVFVETCPYNLRAFDRIITPITRRNKIAVSRVDVDCGSGASDQGTGSAAAQSAVLRFQSAGVDSVMFDSNFENGLVYFFAAQADAQQYKPQYLLFHNQGCPACVAGWSNMREQLEKMRGFGGLPIWDVTFPPAPPPAQAAARRTCLASAKRQGVNVAGPDKQAILFDSCDAVGLLRRALTLSGGLGGTRSITSAIERVGADFVSTMTLNGATRFGPGRHDGMELTAVSVWKDKCACIAYSSPARPVQ